MSISLEKTKTGKKCVKCGNEIIMRNSHRFPYDIIIECSYCHKKYKLEVSTGHEKVDVVGDSSPTTGKCPDEGTTLSPRPHDNSLNVKDTIKEGQ